jgi:hypothetical protein
LEKNYHITRVGIADVVTGEEQHLIFGIEYDTDYYTGVLFIPVAMELANNIMSQIGRSDVMGLAEPQPSFEVIP